MEIETLKKEVLDILKKQYNSKGDKEKLRLNNLRKNKKKELESLGYKYNKISIK